jgi:hypothetical protein
MTEKIYQFHIALEYIKPLIWRRFLVRDDITLDKLHKIIQAVMGWEDCHLYEFRINGIKYGRPDDAWDDPRIHDDKKVRLRDLELKENQKFDYIYDFGDNWGHEVKLEKILLPESGVKYPKCLEGKRACPPEDCFGPPGYESLIELTERPKDKLDEYDLDRLAWMGEDHDFEYFSSDEVNSILWKRFAK